MTAAHDHIGNVYRLIDHILANYPEHADHALYNCILALLGSAQAQSCPECSCGVVAQHEIVTMQCMRLMIFFNDVADLLMARDFGRAEQLVLESQVGLRSLFLRREEISRPDLYEAFATFVEKR